MTISFGANYPTLGLFVNFSGSTWTDVSSYIRRLDTNRGASRETGKYPPGTMSVVLDNRDGRFSPSNTSGPYSSGGVTQVVAEIRTRLTATWNGVTYGLFAGNVEDWADDFPEQGYDAVTVMTAIDPLSVLASWAGTATAPGGAEESSGTRVGRLLDAAGWSATQRSIMYGDETLQATTLEGGFTSQMGLIVDCEGGAYWYDPALTAIDTFGAFVFESRTALASNTRSTTSQATFSPASIPFRDVRTSSGRDQIVRQAAYTRLGGAQQVAGSGSPRLYRTDLVNITDQGVKAVVDLTVLKGAPSQAYRVVGLTLDPVLTPSASWPAALGLRIRDRASVSFTVQASGITVSRNVFIDGVSHSIEPMRWETSYQFASATAWDPLGSASQWGTATWGSGSWWPY